MHLLRIFLQRVQGGGERNDTNYLNAIFLIAAEISSPFPKRIRK